MDTKNKFDNSFWKFIGRSVLFLLTLGIIRLIVGWMIPYHIGGREISEKIKFIEDNKKRIDVLFLGSSRVRRAVIPTLFDSLTHLPDKRDGISFNLGGPAASVGENLYLIRNFSASDAGVQLKSVIVEWVDEYLPKVSNYETERGRYWMDMESFLEQWRIMHEHPGLNTAIFDGRMSYLTSAFLLRTLGLRRISSALMDSLKTDSLLESNHGYAKLDARHATLLSSGPVIPGKPVYDPVQAGRDAVIAQKLHSIPDLPHSNEDLRLWNRMIREYKDRGIRLILFIPPGPVTNRQLALLRQLPTDHYIDLSDPHKYPDLYDPNIFYDFVHLNHEGAERLTRHLAAAFIERIP